MSNVTLFEQSVPDYLKEVEMDEMTRRYAGGSSGKRISIRGRVFRLMVGGKEVSKNENNYMNVVIVAGGKDIARYYHAKAYNAGDTSPPDCFSNDGIAPDMAASSPQSDKCETCPMNIKGSGTGESRACRFQQRLAVVLAEYIEGDVYELALPSKSLFGRGALDKMPFQQYLKYVGSQGRNINTLVTEMRFDSDSDTPKLVFKPVRYLTREEWIQAKKQGETPEARNALRISVSPASKQIAAPAAEVVVAPEPAAEPEPVKRTAKKNAEPPPAKKGFTDIVSDWSTDDE